MPQTNPPLPVPPEYPASNASYNKIVGKMHKAAIAAETSTAAIAALEMCKGMVGGVNTYAKSCRRYADVLIAALTPTPAIGFKAYSSLSNAKRAVKAAGLNPDEFTYVDAEDGKVVPAVPVKELA